MSGQGQNEQEVKPNPPPPTATISGRAKLIYSIVVGIGAIFAGFVLWKVLGIDFQTVANADYARGLITVTIILAFVILGIILILAALFGNLGDEKESDARFPQGSGGLYKRRWHRRYDRWILFWFCYQSRGLAGYQEGRRQKRHCEGCGRYPSLQCFFLVEERQKSVRF